MSPERHVAPSAVPARRAARGRLLGAGLAAAVAIMLSLAWLSYRGVRRLTEGVHRAASAAAGLSAGGDAAERLAALRRDLAANEAGIDAQERSLILVAALARCVGAGVLIVAFLLVRRHMAERTRAESALVEARDAALRDAAVLRLAQEENLRLSDRLRAVLDHVESGVVLVESNMTIVVFNRAAERIHGAWRGEIERIWRSGQFPPLRLDGKTPLPPEEDPLLRALKGETVLDARVFLRTPVRPDGYVIRASTAPMRTAQGVITGAILIFREDAA